jgi:hypothetical protein
VRPERLLALAAVGAGLIAWLAYLDAGLVLSHYDAKAHLVVARRVIDNLTPGWQQLGAVWLPLPHVIHLLPTQIDALYRTGAFASLVSVACLGVTTFAAARLVLLMTGSVLGASVAAALLALNPNLLYLHTTAMTEPLFLATTSLAVLWLYEWAPTNEARVPRRLGWLLFAAMWTRYEAWPVMAAGIAATVFASRRLGASRALARRRALSLLAWPAAAVAIFAVNSRITVGQWFVTGGFFVPDPRYFRQPLQDIAAIGWGAAELTTLTTVIVGVGVALVLLGQGWLYRVHAALLIPISLFAAAAVPFYAFFEGHPFRVRYMIPMAAACAIYAGASVGIVRQHAVYVFAGLLIGITLIQSPPWRQDAPMLLEAQWDLPASAARRAVTVCLAGEYAGDKVLASMGSLAHYMQELSHDGFRIADFIHEGNGVIWDLAMETGPAPHAGWMLVEEEAEGGDVLAQRIRGDAAFTSGMNRVCEGGGVALYKRATARTGSPR